MALNTKPPSNKAFDRAVSKAGDKKRGYGMGLDAGNGRRQITITLPEELLERLNATAERTHQQRGGLITLAIQRLLESDDPSFGSR